MHFCYFSTRPFVLEVAQPPVLVARSETAKGTGEPEAESPFFGSAAAEEEYNQQLPIWGKTDRQKNVFQKRSAWPYGVGETALLAEGVIC